MTNIRYLFVAMPGEEARQAILAFLKLHGLDIQLGSAMFAAENWHQSLSDRFWAPSDVVIDALRRAGSLVSAHPLQLLFNRLTSENGPQIHWTLRARGKPKMFDALLMTIDDALAAVGLPRGPRHEPHITVSYRATSTLKTLPIHPPIPWLVDELLLVRGGRKDGKYQYEIDRSWPFKASPQMALF